MKVEGAPITAPATPLPKKLMLCAMLVPFMEGVQNTFLFPFVAWMVEEMGYRDAALGPAVGFLAGAFSLGQFFSAYLWGIFADRCGRRLGISVGMSTMSLALVMFGFSRSLRMAVTARMLSGFLYGNASIVKAYLMDITDATNRGKAFSFFALFFGSGTMIGPLIGGYLSRPAQSFPELVPPGSLLDRFPYLLPSAAVALMSVTAATVEHFWMEDKHAEASRESPAGAPGGRVLLRRGPVFAIACYGFTCSLQMMFDETCPLFWKLSRREGGLGFTQAEVGTVLSIAGVSLWLVTFVLVPWVDRRMRRIPALRLAMWSLVPFFVLFPLLSRLPPEGLLTDVAAVLLGMGKYLVLSLPFIYVGVVMNETVPRSHAGRINGVAQSMASISRCLGPNVSGAVWSLSLASPLGAKGSFLAIGAWAVLGALVTRGVRERDRVAEAPALKSPVVEEEPHAPESETV